MHTALRVLLIGIGLLVLAGLLLDGWSRLPARFDVPPLALPAGTRDAVLIFHGRGGKEEPVVVNLAGRFEALAAEAPGTAIVRYVWSPWSDTRFRSQPNGAHLGEVLGAELAALPDLENLHLVGHSAGAYVLDPLCAAYKAAGGRARVSITYLDPIGFRGVLDTGYGARNYGACADYAEAFINTDDPVPATNSPLRQAWTIDVTGAPSRAAFTGDGHRWPVQFYADQLTVTDIAPLPADPASRPRGGIERK